MIRGARSHNLHLGFVVRKLEERPFQLSARLGEEGLRALPARPDPDRQDHGTLTPLSDANRDADARAFAALMRHVKEVDGREHTVVMIQVENEVGMQGDTRDRSPVAEQAFAGPVPKELMDYLQQHKDTLIPEFRQVWEAAGFKTSGNLGRGVRPEHGDGRNLHGLELCALRRPGGRGGQSRIPAADVRERGADPFVLDRGRSQDEARVRERRRGHLPLAARWTT